MSKVEIQNAKEIENLDWFLTILVTVGIAITLMAF